MSLQNAIREGSAMAQKTTAEKLQMKTGRTVAFINPPHDHERLIGPLPPGVELREPADVVILFAKSRAELEALLPGAKMATAPNGMIWVAYHKGTSRVITDINRDSINAYAHTQGMTGVAMVSIDDDWAALRLRTD
jgi:hypothetical protein